MEARRREAEPESGDGLRARLKQVKNGVNEGGRTAIIAAWSTTTISHVNFQWLTGDPQRPGWNVIDNHDRERRIVAVQTLATASGPLTYEQLFNPNPDILKGGQERQRRAHAGRLAIGAGSPLTLSRRSVLFRRCKRAAVDEGLAYGSDELKERTNELFEENVDLLEGEHECEDCTPPLEWIILTNMGALCARPPVTPGVPSSPLISGECPFKPHDPSALCHWLVVPRPRPFAARSRPSHQPLRYSC